jgi:hypothetical protein
MNSIKGTYLSNFYESKVVYKKLAYRNAEAAFQAMKARNPEDRVKFVDLTGAEAKALGRGIPMREDWDDVKLSVMYEVVGAKFAQNPEIAKLLVDTNDEVIIEGNTWGDTFWGMCNGKGSNHLGIILMAIREECK